MTGAEIKNLRSRLGLSQERAARLLGTTLMSWHPWESGLTKPHNGNIADIERLQKIVEVLEGKGWDREKIVRWLTSYPEELLHCNPVETLRSEFGFLSIMKLLASQSTPA